jgi:fucose permease
MGIAAVIGRQIWARVAPKITVYRTLTLLVPVSTVFVFLAPLPNSVIINIILFFIAMIFISGINPLFLSAAAVYPKSHSSSAYTILFISISIGGIIIPFVIGQIFEYTSPIIGMSSISLLFVIVIVLLLSIKKELPISEHIHRHPMP